jgi:hypothetical protein
MEAGDGLIGLESFRGNHEGQIKSESDLQFF